MTGNVPLQLFGLVNNLLGADRNTADRNLSIARYAVIPLSPNSGLIGWVRNCDTLHALIREFRDSRSIPLNEEHRIMQSLAPNYDQMMVIQKVEVFEDALERTSGEDLQKVRTEASCRLTTCMFLSRADCAQARKLLWCAFSTAAESRRVAGLHVAPV